MVEKQSSVLEFEISQSVDHVLDTLVLGQCSVWSTHVRSHPSRVHADHRDAVWFQVVAQRSRNHVETSLKVNSRFIMSSTTNPKFLKNYSGLGIELVHYQYDELFPYFAASVRIQSTGMVSSVFGNAAQDRAHVHYERFVDVVFFRFI